MTRPTAQRLQSAAAILALLCFSFSTAFSQSVTGPYAGYTAQAKQQVDQAKIQIEQLKLQQAEYRAGRNEAAAKRLDSEIARYQNQITLKQQEISVYQQQDTLSKQPLSNDPSVAAAQNLMRQWTFEKAQLALRQTAATQAGNKVQADQLTQQMNGLQLKIAAKQQEIRLLEAKAKAGQ